MDCFSKKTNLTFWAAPKLSVHRALPAPINSHHQNQTHSRRRQTVTWRGTYSAGSSQMLIVYFLFHLVPFISLSVYVFILHTFTYYVYTGLCSRGQVPGWFRHTASLSRRFSVVVGKAKTTWSGWRFTEVSAVAGGDCEWARNSAEGGVETALSPSEAGLGKAIPKRWYWSRDQKNYWV